MNRLVEFLVGLSGPTPYLVVFSILLACGLGVPIPEDITLFAAGLASYYQVADVHKMVVVSFVGVLLGDSIIFMLGRKYGRSLTRKWFFKKLLSEERLDLVQKRLHEQGKKLIFFGRFMPGLRAPIYFSSGTLRYPFRVFILFDGLAALISVPLIVYAVWYFGDEVDKVITIIQRIEHGIALGIVTVVLILVGKWYWKKRRGAARAQQA